MKRILILSFFHFFIFICFAQRSANIVFIGNSITYGALHEQRELTAPPTQCARWLSQQDGIDTVYFRNCGRSGKTTYHFLPNAADVIPAGDKTYFADVVAKTRELVSAHPNLPLVFSIMLGTNDTVERKHNSHTTPDDYARNLCTIIDSLLKLWPEAHVVLNKPIWYTPDYVTKNGSVASKQSLKLLDAYYDKFPQVVKNSKPGHVHIGDSEAYAHFKKHYKTDVFEEKDSRGRCYWLHPNEQGAKKLAEYWGKAILPVLMSLPQTHWPLAEPLPDEAWNDAEWISVADAPVVTGRVNEQTRAADGANWFVTTIQNDREVVKALWMTTSLGINELYVNGQRIGNEVLRPGFSHHSRTKYSFTYDVTHQFQTKKGAANTLAAQVTPGWWADKIITPRGHQGMYGQKCAFRGVLELTFANGTTQRYGTNATDWKAGIAGPVTHAAIFDGEAYDARIALGFLTPDKLGTPAVSKEYAGVITPDKGAEIYHLDELSLRPKRAYVYAKTEGATDEAYGRIIIEREYTAGKPMMVKQGEHLVIDFGQNCAAVPSFRFKAKAGTCLTCLPAELLNDGNGAKSRGMDNAEGSIHRKNLRINVQSIRLDYTFADSETAVDYRPRCTFFGYRYLDITATDEVLIEQIKSVPVSSITPDMETGYITTGNELVNQLIANTLWGMRSNYLSVPTDCPQRNERLGWTADTQVFCETGTYFANTNRFFHKWLQDLRDTQNSEGGYPSVAPAGQYGSSSHEYMRVGWADAGIIVPWTVWKQYGDASVIDESWESMERFMAHVAQTKYDHTALAKENGNYQYADWLSYEPMESCGGHVRENGQPLPDVLDYWNYLCASYWAIDAAMMADMARATGRNAQYYETMTEQARQYLRDHFFNENGTFKCAVLNTMQTPALFALHNNLFEGEAKAKTIERLRENFSQHDNCLQTGFLGTSILMPTLTDNGMADVAYTLLFQRKNPSWLYSVDNGATTIWERWNSYMKEKGMGPNGMNSFNHYAYGCVCQWLWQTCAGIASDPARPGFRHIIMKPVPDRRLGHLDASYQSAAGLIKSSWRYEGDEWIWTVTIPEGSTATVHLPDGKVQEIASGTNTFQTKISQ